MEQETPAKQELQLGVFSQILINVQLLRMKVKLLSINEIRKLST